MTKKYNRLSKEEVSGLFKKGSRKKINGLFFLFKKNKIDLSRLTVVVSKKNIKGAVRRNLLKRKIRALLRTANLKGLDIVVVIKEKDYNIKNCKKDVEKFSSSLSLRD